MGNGSEINCFADTEHKIIHVIFPPEASEDDIERYIGGYQLYLDDMYDSPPALVIHQLPEGK